MNDAAPQSRWSWSRRSRNLLLTFHIIVAVGLLGDSAGFLAVAVRAAATVDPALRIELVRVLVMFAAVFGIPLSFLALLSGLALGIGSRWGVFRYPWVVIKLALILSVILVGALAIGPALTATLHHGADATSRLIAAAAYDVIALSTATALSVYKPGKRFGSARDVPAVKSGADIR